MTATIGNLSVSHPRKIAITMGDPAGIGPEICAKFCQEIPLGNQTIPFILGDWSVLKPYFENLLSRSQPLEIISIKALSNSSSIFNPTKPTIVDFQQIDLESFAKGQVSAEAGAAAFAYIDHAIDLALHGHVDAIVTGPINKLSLHAAGYDYPGHTEIFAEKASTDDFCMMQYSDEVTCSFVTTHIGYADVTDALSTERILDVIKLTDQALSAIHNNRPRLVTCGLNPHAGEDGLFGHREEENIIVPAIERAIELGIQIEGPLPPDTCFIPSRRKTTDGFICMYHDQGHIPLKALAFDKAVNVTLGLPIIRTSVDHGTAFDIVDRNIADPSSLKAAFKLAAKLATIVNHN